MVGVPHSSRPTHQEGGVEIGVDQVGEGGVKNSDDLLGGGDGDSEIQGSLGVGDASEDEFDNSTRSCWCGEPSNSKLSLLLVPDE